MGRAVEALARERDCTVVAWLGRADTIDAASLGGADVALEFSVPGAAAHNVRACLAARCPVVSGTTGWADELPAVADEVAAQGGAMLWAANFSIGVNLFVEVARRAGELMSRAPSFDVHLTEVHHSAKIDAPSGTARLIAAAVAESAGSPVPITSVRTGFVPGTHTLTFDAAFEQVTLEHVARDRQLFADGALLAARWLVSRVERGRRGVFTMADVLSLHDTL
jgi:4-hydroxy-tetrahydrodipicolinate reductase